MGSRLWRTLLVAAGTAVVAVTTGTAVMAMIGDDADPAPAVGRQALDESPEGGGANVASICLEGATDCDDTIDGGRFAQCATEESCGDFDARCAADGADCPQLAPTDADCAADGPNCPQLALPGYACEGAASLEECFPDGVPAGVECVTAESFPVQIKCYPIECPVDGPVTIPPAPDDGGATILPAPAPVEPTEPSTGDDLTDTNIAVGEEVGEPMPAVQGCTPVECMVTSPESSYQECTPIEPCVPADNVRCIPPECEILEDGSVVCKIPPPVGCGADESCVPPPDCAVSSDGVTYCPDPMPLPCVDSPNAGEPGCSSPGSPGVVCPDGVTEEECKLRYEQGGGSSSSGGVAEPAFRE